jgi:hypothetical protein
MIFDPVTISAFITGVLGPTIIIAIKHKLAKNQKNKAKIDPLVEVMEFNKTVNQQLDLILDKAKCDRVWISQFHNGGTFYPTGKSIQKFSIFYEHITPNTPSIKETFNNIPVSLFSRSLSTLYEKGIVKIEDYSKDNTYGLEIYTDNFNTKSSYIFALYDLNQNFIGTLGIEYIKEKYSPNQELLDFIKSKTAALGTIFSSYLYTNNNAKK